MIGKKSRVCGDGDFFAQVEKSKKIHYLRVRGEVGGIGGESPLERWENKNLQDL